MKMFLFSSRFPVIFLALLLSSCVLSNSLAQTTAPNPPPGFKPLFDGRTLAGWHTAPRVGMPKNATEALSPTPPKKPAPKTSPAQANAKGRWDVRDGVVYGGQDAQRVVHAGDNADWGLGSWLMSDATFGDFELSVDARPDWPCDTGIYVRATPIAQGFQVLLDHRGDDPAGIGGSVGFIYLRGLANQRVDPYNFRWTVGTNGLPIDVKLAPGTDGVTKLEYACTSDDFRRAWHFNDWNNFRIRVVGAQPRITVWINNVKISECDTADIQHRDYNAADTEKLLGPRGHIAFEVHDGPPWRWGIDKFSRWKNIYIREL